jgi:hypothetical protein|tara:strand:+ start:15 stop:449 length:435 start_codon:yes stop_codon:yes gene_type:complete
MEQELSILAYNNGNQITVGIYSVLTVILAFIALRVARFSQGTHIAGKVISTIFGIMSGFFILDVQSYRHFWNDVTATYLAKAKDNGIELSTFASNWVEQSGLSGNDIVTRGLFNDIPLLVFVLVLLLIVLGTIWGPKINFGNDN